MKNGYLSLCLVVIISAQLIKGEWTKYINSNALSGGNDIEDYDFVTDKGHCKGKPVVRMMYRPVSGSTGCDCNVVELLPNNRGISCTAANQPTPCCNCCDYEVAYECCGTTTKTSWLDRDNIGGSGDYELWIHLTSAQKGACDGMPVVGVEYEKVDPECACNEIRVYGLPNPGVACVNKKAQVNGCENSGPPYQAYCCDWKVRFECCSCPQMGDAGDGDDVPFRSSEG